MTQRLPEQDHLRTGIRMRLEQNGIHARVGVHAGRLGLDDLSAAHFVAGGRDPGIQRHVLRLERSRAVAVLAENAAVGRRQDAFARVGRGSLQHERGSRAGRSGADGERNGAGRARSGFFHQRSQRVGQPAVVLGETDRDPEPCAVFKPGVIGTVAHGDAEALEQRAIQVRGRSDPAEQHVIGGGRKHVHAGQSGQGGDEIGAAFGVFRAGALREVRNVVERGHRRPEGEDIDVPGGQFGAYGRRHFVRGRQIAEAHPGRA